MIPLKRQQAIVNHLLSVQVAEINELAEMLDVSAMTIRRDVQRLELEGRVVSVTGGVALSTEIRHEPSHMAKRDLQRGEKEAIADLAEELVSPDSTIYLDAGTTMLALARRLVERGRHNGGLMVVTNDFAIASYLIDNSQFRLYHTGGEVIRENRSCAGTGAANALRKLNIEQAFISAPSWNTRWITTPDAEKTFVKKAAVASAVSRVLLADSSKYGKIGAFKAVSMSNINLVITDSGLAEGAREALERQGIHLCVAKAAK